MRCWCFRGSTSAATEQIAFARRFGALEFELAPISNVRADGSSCGTTPATDDVIKVLKGNMGWHADSTYMPVQAKGAVFSAGVRGSTYSRRGRRGRLDAPPA